MSIYVCDSSVMIAYLKQEKGWQIAEKYLENSVISAVNFAEVVAKFNEEGKDTKPLSGEYNIYNYNEELAMISGNLRSKTKDIGLSLGDRACLALGIKLDKPVVTADKVWLKLKIGTKIICIR